jgi:uncharacterized protein YlxW (UPF0749 family)
MQDAKPNGNIMRALTGALVAIPVIGGAVTFGQSMGDADATRRDVTRLQDRVAQLNEDVTDLESRVRVLSVRLERLRTDDTNQGPHQ